MKYHVHLRLETRNRTFVYNKDETVKAYQGKARSLKRTG